MTDKYGNFTIRCRWITNELRLGHSPQSRLRENRTLYSSHMTDNFSAIKKVVFRGPKFEYLHEDGVSGLRFYISGSESGVREIYFLSYQTGRRGLKKSVDNLELTDILQSMSAFDFKYFVKPFPL